MAGFPRHDIGHAQRQVARLSSDVEHLSKKAAGLATHAALKRLEKAHSDYREVSARKLAELSLAIANARDLLSDLHTDIDSVKSSTAEYKEDKKKWSKNFDEFLAMQHQIHGELEQVSHHQQELLGEHRQIKEKHGAQSERLARFEKELSQFEKIIPNEKLNKLWESHRRHSAFVEGRLKEFEGSVSDTKSFAEKLHADMRNVDDAVAKRLDRLMKEKEVYINSLVREVTAEQKKLHDFDELLTKDMKKLEERVARKIDTHMREKALEMETRLSKYNDEIASVRNLVVSLDKDVANAVEGAQEKADKIIGEKEAYINALADKLEKERADLKEFSEKLEQAAAGADERFAKKVEKILAEKEKLIAAISEKMSKEKDDMRKDLEATETRIMTEEDKFREDIKKFHKDHNVWDIAFDNVEATQKEIEGKLDNFTKLEKHLQKQGTDLSRQINDSNKRSEALSRKFEHAEKVVDEFESVIKPGAIKKLHENIGGLAKNIVAVDKINDKLHDKLLAVDKRMANVERHARTAEAAGNKAEELSSKSEHRAEELDRMFKASAERLNTIDTKFSEFQNAVAEIKDENFTIKEQAAAMEQNFEALGKMAGQIDEINAALKNLQQHIAYLEKISMRTMVIQ
ncbi:MAG: hypothetical protein HYT16_03175 [DPANN group archaeon]|nr:hypothetical protein [DPANN group archaeon]